MNIISNLVKKSIDNQEPANILTFGYDGIFDFHLCKTPHNFYGSIEASTIKWNPITKNTPNNFHYLDNNFVTLGNNRDFDLIICNGRHNYIKAMEFANALHIPVITIDHLPLDIKQKSLATIHTCPLSKNKYDNSELIEYMVEPPKQQMLKDVDVLICGQFLKNEYHLVENLKSKLTCKYIFIGNNKGLSKPVYDKEYIECFNRSKIYINLSTNEGVSPYLLQAMVSGCHIISNKTPAIFNIFKDDISYLHDTGQILELINNLLDNPMLESISNNMRNIAKSRFNPNKFITSWTEIFYRYKNRVFIR